MSNALPEGASKRPLCIENGCSNLAEKVSGKTRYRPRCINCRREANGRPRSWPKEKERARVRPHNWIVPYSSFKKNQCERCEFEAEHSCQLDVHHKDGNHYNNSPENLQTLCANCHRLVEQNVRDAKRTAAA